MKSWSGLCLAALVCLAAWPARAQDFLTIDFPIRGEIEIPQGLSAPPRQVAAPDGKGYAELLFRPARKGQHVFLTFVFEEDGGRGPAVFWSGDASGEQMTLAENLAEGVEGWNRRTIELPEAAASEAGHLYILGRQDRLRRVRIDWCEPANTFVAADQELPKWIQGGALKLDRELTGKARLAPPDAWFGPVLDAALQDGVADLSETTELMVPIRGTVSAARLRAKFLGLPLGRSVKVWVNGELAGRMQPALPSLTDPGYVRRTGKRATYAGWREAAIFIEPRMLREGENSIVFKSPGAGVYLSGAAMEFRVETAEAPSETAPQGKPAADPAPPEQSEDE